MFVSKHGGQSEIILRVKQGDNPTFGFLMPGHQLHAYFRFLVEHPVLHAAFDGKSQDEGKNAGSEQKNLNTVAGSLSLLGSVYGSGEEEEGDDTAKTEEDVTQDNIDTVSRTISDGLKKMESQANAAKDEPMRNPILSNKEKVLAVKKNSSITALKSGTVKGKEEKSRLFSASADTAKSTVIGGTSKSDTLVLEPPAELKRLIEKIVEFIMRNGKQFEATLVEQDSEHGRFPFLLPSNRYHSYYLKVLQTAQETKLNSRSSYSSKDSSSLGFAACDMPLESDRKEKFKMVISKSKKEAQETESRGTQQECGITVDAAAAAAILQAATRGVNNSNLRIISSTSSSPHSQPDNASEKSAQIERHNVSAVDSKTIARTAALEAAAEADSSEAHMTKEQKLKAERLKRARIFVAMLKSGAVPFKTGASRGSSVEPLEPVSRSSGEVHLDGKEGEGSLTPADVQRVSAGHKPEMNYFGEEQTERLSKRKYRSRSGGYEDDDEDNDGEMKERNKKHRSRSGRHYEGDENENVNSVETEHRRRRRKHQSYSSSDENEDKGEHTKEDRDHKHRKSMYRSYGSQEDEEYEEKHKDDKHHKRSRNKHCSHHSSRERSRKKRSSKKYSCEEDEHDDDDEGIGREHSRKKHRSRHSSHHSRDKHSHRNRHSSRDTESQHNLKHDDCSSIDDHQDSGCLDKHKKELYGERDELEEGEISSRVSEESRGIAGVHISRETSADVVSSHQRALSQPPESTVEVPDDLRAKIRAMLMATRL